MKVLYDAILGNRLLIEDLAAACKQGFDDVEDHFKLFEYRMHHRFWF